MTDPTWISLLPPVLAIFLAIWSKQVYMSLAGGLWLAWTILAGWNPIQGLGDAIQGTVAVFGNDGDTKAILFTLVIGAMIATVEASGGVRGFVNYLESNKWVDSAKKSQLLAWATGIVIFIESNITVLVAGSVARPLCDRYKVSREKLAYIIDSTSAPICILIPMNAWGAYNLGILESLGVENPLTVFLQSILFNFYAIAAVLLVLVVIMFGLDIGPMKKAEERTRGGEVLWPDATPMIDEDVLSPEPNDHIKPRAINMIAPIAAMVLFIAGRTVHHRERSVHGRVGFDERFVVRTLRPGRVLGSASQPRRLQDRWLGESRSPWGGRPGASRAHPLAGPGPWKRDRGIGDRSLCGPGDGRDHAELHLSPPRVLSVRRDCLLDGNELGHLRHHASDRGACRHDARPSSGSVRCRIARRRDLRRSLLAD